MDANRRQGVAIIVESSRELERDGDAFDASPGRKQAMQAAKIEAQHRLLGEQYARKHKL